MFATLFQMTKSRLIKYQRMSNIGYVRGRPKCTNHTTITESHVVTSYNVPQTIGYISLKALSYDYGKYGHWKFLVSYPWYPY